MAPGCPITGRALKTSFTIPASARYALAMLILATLLAAAEAPPAPVRQASATVRITRAASLRVGHSKTLEGKPLRVTKLLDTNGNLVPAHLAEFE